ncbi:hypothetical protein K503DRAFT_866375 [Rhizopogon vinicolor AM-OR11-026]|uniref:Uncharacterized protein n=1 Tax=Rhizopogon vinicolor AM-OR11-026 TaxID=1314800 RepID=A0A1B7MZT0_9AGAM|nr:hypothetical protein K503DRAFT_866375 [Rhizopogon vinicolor AM-OR11-026]
MTGFKGAFKTWSKVFRDKQGLQSIVNCMKDGKPGDRAWPKDKSRDKAIGMRIDLGDTFLEGGRTKRNLVLQANKDADHVTLKKMAQKDSHAKLAVVAIDIESPPTQDQLLQAFQSRVDG